MLSRPKTTTVRTYGKRGHRTVFANKPPMPVMMSTVDEDAKALEQPVKPLQMPKLVWSAEPQKNPKLDTEKKHSDTEAESSSPTTRSVRKTTRKKAPKTAKSKKNGQAVSQVARLDVTTYMHPQANNTSTDIPSTPDLKSPKDFTFMNLNDFAAAETADSLDLVPVLPGQEPVAPIELPDAIGTAGDTNSITCFPQPAIESVSPIPAELEAHVKVGVDPESENDTFLNPGDFLAVSTPLLTGFRDNTEEPSTSDDEDATLLSKRDKYVKQKPWNMFQYFTPARKLFHNVYHLSPFVTATPAIQPFLEVNVPPAEVPIMVTDSTAKLVETELATAMKSVTIAPERLSWLPNINTPSIESLLLLCSQNDIASFSRFIKLFTSKSMKKLGEATFSEVFLAEVSTDTLLDQFGSYNENPIDTAESIQVAFKIIPFGDDRNVLVNGEPQTRLDDIYQEVAITRRMNMVKQGHFVRCFGVKIVRGKYPTILLRLWDSWADQRDTENDRPDSYDENQLYCILLLEYGGQDLEHFEVRNATQALGIFQQVALSLAAAETECAFEHRDLHWGNILVKESNADSEFVYSVGGNRTVVIPAYGIKCTIIDYTFSRLALDSNTFFRPYDDEGFFQGQGDYQFDMYRTMRQLVMTTSKSHDPLNIEMWNTFTPQSNVYWLHYLIRKLLEEKGIKKRRKNQADQSRAARELLIGVERRVLDYQSAQHLVARDEIFRSF